MRLRTLAECSPTPPPRNVELRIYGTEVRVRRPKAGRLGQPAFVSGKKKQNAGKATMISDDRGRLLWCGAVVRLAGETRRRPMTPVDLTDSFAKAGVPAFAQRLRGMLVDQD